MGHSSVEQGIEFANKIKFKNFLISHHSPLREDKEIKIIQENELFGEMGVIENELRMATARCLVASEILSITKDEFDKRVNSSDVFVKGSLKALSYRLRAVEKKCNLKEKLKYG